MGERMRALDWSSTPLGPAHRWPSSLKTAVRIMLTSRQPIWIGWGQELIYLYNDPYKSIIGGKHPHMLGQPTSVVWSEIWDDIDHMLATAMGGQEGTYVESQLLIMERHGYPEETYYTFSYSPIPDDDGRPGGIICANTDDTRRVIGERQLALLRELGSCAADARTWEQAVAASVRALESNPRDLPFAAVFLNEPRSQEYFLAGTCGIDAEHDLVKAWLDDSRLSVAARATDQLTVERLSKWSDEPLPNGAWDVSATQMALIPIAASGQTGHGGVLAVGLNPYRLLDDGYRNFLLLVAGQLSASIASAQAYEEERRRAEALAEIDRAKTLFFSNISHEFRTPLTLMLGPVEDILHKSYTELAPSTKSQLEVVHRNSLRMLKLVNTILDFSRIEAGRMRAHFERIDLGDYTAELASNFRSACERAGLELEVDCRFDADAEPGAWVDRDMWEKIVLNLLSNAFKFTLEGRISVSLRCDDDYAVLRVSDTGVGIRSEDLPRVFDRFHRAKESRGRTHEGTGIGLALVHELVKLHGGSVRVESVVDEGTTFEVSIPLGNSHLESYQAESRKPAQSSSPHAHLYLDEAMRWLPDSEENGDDGLLESLQASVQEAPAPVDASYRYRPRARIVWADDNADMRQYVARLLSERFDVEAVGDGVAALEAIRREPPELVLSDVMMPRMDGFELLQKVREDPQLNAIPVILLSARAGEEARIEGVESGADDYLIKPFSARELLARVETHVKIAAIRREASEALRDSEHRFRTLADLAPAMLWVTNAQGHCTYLSKGWYEFTGQTEEEGRGFGWLDAVHPDDRAHSAEAFENATARHESFSIDYRLRRHDGEYRWAIDAGRPHIDSDGRFQGFIGSVIDVHERKQVEAALRESEERFRLLADNMSQFAWIADEKGWIFWYNKRWYDYTGTTLEEMQGWGWMAVHHPDHVDRVVKRVSRCWDTGELWEDTFPLRSKDGEYRWFLSRALPVRDDDGQIVRWFGTNTDITDQRAAQLEREQALQAERSARAEAERMGRMKDEFLANLSHELRTPMTAIMGWTQMLRKSSAEPEDVEKGLEVIERNAQLQSELINDMLDMSRILTGKLRLDIQSVNIGEVVQAAVESIRPAAQAKQLKLETICEPATTTLRGDANRLQQVIFNLLTNAVKFTARRGKVQVVCQRVNSHVEISVSDTGIGIHPDFLANLFERFRQQDSSTTRHFGGLGLGLSIVKQLVELHGGSVQAASEGEGKGATFTVHLPVAIAIKPTLPAGTDKREHPTASGRMESETVSPSQSSLQTAPQDTNGSSAPLRGKKILVVDDQADARDLIGHVLEKKGARVCKAESAADAMEKLARTRFDAIVSDLGMPEVDGHELITNIRALPPEKGGATPAIALTAYARSEDRVKSLLAGFQMHLSKPVNLDELVVSIARLTV